MRTLLPLTRHEIVAGFPYRSVLGAIIYVYVVARIDIGFAVTLLARFSDSLQSRSISIHSVALPDTYA
jgi:hypothetical protein